MTTSRCEIAGPPDAIAIVGMAGRFPGAKTVDELWDNVCAGVESVSFFTDGELECSGIAPETFRMANYVRARGILEDVEYFDAAFFNVSPREAETIDPQHRVFLECAWEALERAGCDPSRFERAIGVFGGASMNSYFISNLYPSRDIAELESCQGLISSDKDFLTTRVSYKLNLTGPSFTVQTACSTSLVAVHLACQSLLNGECDVALAGGASIRIPQKSGYEYRGNGIQSRDGHCRAFDAKASGAVSGNGVAVVALERLSDAQARGDHVHAIIIGSAINNDGGSKVGFTAPSVDGQAAVIAEALAIAGASAGSVTYVEAHGTGTPLGDPVELAALTRVFRAHTDARAVCAIGSVKTNIGHLDAAAGVASLIKTALALEHRILPPSLHFDQPNASIEFEKGPFYVSRCLSEWKATRPRRAGVSSFGLGGTNAHVVLEEAPPDESWPSSRPFQLIVLSARTGPALDAATSRLADHLRRHPDACLPDIAHTLQVGRKAFTERRVLVCQTRADVIDACESLDEGRLLTASVKGTARPVAFMFPGGGAQHVGMGRGLYESEPTFRQTIDRCANLLRDRLGVDLREILYGCDDTDEERRMRLRQPSIALPALFVTEYALAMLWMSWGVRPSVLIGHSLGEYTAAHLAGVLSLEDALSLVSVRGHLLEELAPGSMLAVPLPEEAVRGLLDREISLAAINNPELCVVSGPTARIRDLQHALSERGVEARPLHLDAAAHSPIAAPALDDLRRCLDAMSLEPPQLPYASNVTGTWITEAEATSPAYWLQHLNQTVRFSDCMHAALENPDVVLLEVGPGVALSSLARRHPSFKPTQAVLASLPHERDPRPDGAVLFDALGRLWLAGVQVDWDRVWSAEKRRKVPLPTYPFERRRYWVDPPRSRFSPPSMSVSGRTAGVDDGAGLERDERGAPAADSSASRRSSPATGVRLLPNRTYVAPRNAREQRIADLWQRMLGIDLVGAEDNFFQLGGDSLRAIEVFAAIRDELHTDLSLETIFSAPTVAALAALIGEPASGPECVAARTEEGRTTCS